MRVPVCVALVAAGAVYCQTPERFAVASIKPAAESPNGYSGGKTGRGKLTMTNVTLKRCIMGAYGLGPNQIVGGPQWLDSDRFDIVAKAEQPTDDDALFDAMFRNLLAERFHLSVHRETKTIPAYVLEVARNGPKLEKAGAGDSTTDNGRGNIAATFITMDGFAEVLSRQMDLPVVNRTGLEGTFNLKLKWTPETSRQAALDAVSVFTAVRDQLGLHLRAQKAPVPVLVIDRAAKPTEN